MTSKKYLQAGILVAVLALLAIPMSQLFSARCNVTPDQLAVEFDSDTASVQLNPSGTSISVLLAEQVVGDLPASHYMP